GCLWARAVSAGEPPPGWAGVPVTAGLVGQSAGLSGAPGGVGGRGGGGWWANLLVYPGLAEVRVSGWGVIGGGPVGVARPCGPASGSVGMVAYYVVAWRVWWCHEG